MYRRTSQAVFVYGFAKSERANIDAGEVAAFRAAAVHVLALSDEQVAALIAKEQFVEVRSDDQEVPE
ncbi:MAG: type II toxin-antitoxin system RelE/ParE family toxin [Phreatobacter sp.]